MKCVLFEVPCIFLVGMLESRSKYIHCSTYFYTLGKERYYENNGLMLTGLVVCTVSYGMSFSPLRFMAQV